MPVQSAPMPEAEALVARVWPHYALPAPIVCGPTNVGLNAHHLVTTHEGQYVPRVYRRGWRTEEDIAYELAVLLHLATRGVPACPPLANQEDAYRCPIQDAEGPRTAVVFACAPGEAPDATDPEALRTCGRVMALIHTHTDDFTCEHHRFALDLGHLLDRRRATLLPSPAHRPADAVFVRELARALRPKVEAQTGNLEWGFCHGDFHGGNARLEADGTLRAFDCDCGGPGWRAYDLPVCRLSCKEEARWGVFCQGYEEVRLCRRRPAPPSPGSSSPVNSGGWRPSPRTGPGSGARPWMMYSSTNTSVFCARGGKGTYRRLQLSPRASARQARGVGSLSVERTRHDLR